MRVFVLLFNAGTDNEGIHSIRVGDRNTIMMFESEDDATRFALMLEAQDFPTPTVEGMEEQDIIDFCKSAGFGWELVPENSNTVVTPPEQNVEETDWKPEGQTQNNYDNYSSQSEEQQMSDSELDSFRRRLEGLL
ncbi:DUF3110 domain-containing protein [Sphaerospermopsis sp. FACHB-1194]|uniref:DUF3110 domain-containing protein n=1 Tax=Sphaerospermopsis sp. FACHB-1194 TaxID=2692862 RepID=UPI00167FED7D|nr:DUF3110 domain-containing protein [Sphaerospermopsis sp. FACHB-1194]MBD2147547.1 DUF3110 domain-containing protein [Sphaerospermopsis sp. FACHB-1194]